MAEEKKTGTESAGVAAAKKTKPKTITLKKPLRYGGAVRAAGTPVVLSDKRQARLAVKGYV